MERFPDRAWDTGISEQHAVTFSGGLALAGLRPVCAIYSTFLQRGFDSVVHDVALQEAPVLLAVDRGGIAGNDGATHNGFLDISYLRPVPGLVLMAPGDERELELMLRFGLQLEGPSVVRYARAQVPPPLPYPGGECPPVELGKGQIVAEGEDLVLLAYGDMVSTCLATRELLEARGIRACVVNARFAQPLDHALLLELARRDVPIMTVEDHLEQGGFGSAVLECYAARCSTPPRVTVAGLPREFIEHGGREVILDVVGLSSRRLAERALRLVGIRGRPPSPVR
jgi:1-deoxy-D-xylulose-5-phosphate synthase